MAYTKIHAIKATVNKAIDYICNVEKTNEKLLISSYACSPETAAINFKYTLAHTSQHDDNKAYHLIQSFLPGEVSFDEAHLIGQELADKVLEGKYSYVVSTHIDKGHVHNHIIFCAADNLEHNKYHDCKQTYYRIRKLSDELCAKHNLSIIKPSGERGKTYLEWQANQAGSSWKIQLRKDINMSIEAASTYEEFLLLIRAKGYEIKGEELSENAPKFIAFRPINHDRFARGSVKILGKEYTKERIKERIDEKHTRQVSFSEKNYASRRLVDTSDEKFQNSIGLQRWANLENLKIAAQTYQQVESITELEQKIATLNETGKSARQTVVTLEKQMKSLSEVLKYAKQYQENRSFQIRYKKAKNPDAFLRKYESQLILYDGAERLLEQSGVSPASCNVEKLTAQFQTLQKQKAELTSTYRGCEKDSRDLERKLSNLKQYLGQDSTSNQKHFIIENSSHTL